LAQEHAVVTEAGGGTQEQSEVFQLVHTGEHEEAARREEDLGLWRRWDGDGSQEAAMEREAHQLREFLDAGGEASDPFGRGEILQGVGRPEEDAYGELAGPMGLQGLLDQKASFADETRAVLGMFRGTCGPEGLEGARVGMIEDRHGPSLARLERDQRFSGK